ncbi:glycoside hydrolase superfamily [Xylariales sp. PMI_506]|nr:glycoside hydrolase superfamily [Xylariales sp. PMI_506]
MGSISGVDSLLAKLTLKEKVSLLAGADWWRSPIINRDNVFVPHIKLTDGPNGARGESYVSGIKAACFPCGTCLGATFDTDILYHTGKAIAKEAKSKAANVLLGPTLNIIRSPLGGRNYETYSEDPQVLGELSAAYVRGCQSEGIAATPKHFVANDAENQRTTLSVEVDEQTLREIYLKAFQLVMKFSDPWCFMTSYNRVNGEYVADSSRLVNDVLREEWGFKGLVISDWMGTYSLGPGLEAGLDFEMPGPPKKRTWDNVVKAIKEGSLSEKAIDNSARRILQLAERLGRFENPSEPPEQAVEDPKRDNFIKTSAADGMVLLKNDGVLPIPQGASVAMIGQHAHSVVLGGGGSARVDALHAVSPIEGMQNLGFDLKTAAGVPVFGAVPHADPSLLFETGKTEASAKPIKVEWYNGSTIGQNLVHQEMQALPEYMIKEKWPDYLDQDYCSRMTFDLLAPSSGPHILSVITTGKASCYVDGQLAFERPQETNLRPESFYFFKRYLEKRFTYQMEAGRRYTIVLESWACDPDILNSAPIFGLMFQGSALRFHEHIDLDQRKIEATEAAKTCDYAVVCVGTTNEIESEGYDRDTMDLTTSQYDLIEAVVAANKKTVVVNFSGAPVGMSQFADNAPAILQAWFPGQEGGDAMAAVLSGLINPSGKLPLSWPKKLEDNPSFGNFPVSEDGLLHYAEGIDVGYRWYDRPENPEPLYPFGFGLAYTTFSIENASIEGSNILSGATSKITLSCNVKNTGDKRGKTVVQVYSRSLQSHPPKGHRRPEKELQAFAKIEIGANETKQISFNLDKYAISIYNADSAVWTAEQGNYELQVGFSSSEILYRLPFVVVSSFIWTGI